MRTLLAVVFLLIGIGCAWADSSCCAVKPAPQVATSTDLPSGLQYPGARSTGTNQLPGVSSLSALAIERPASEVAEWYYAKLRPDSVKQDKLFAGMFSEPLEAPRVSSWACADGKACFYVCMAGLKPSVVIAMSRPGSTTSVTVMPTGDKSCNVVIWIGVPPATGVRVP